MEKHTGLLKLAQSISDHLHTGGRAFTLLAVVCGLLAANGCTTWTGGFPMNNPARVPPPGTGSYPQPANYYQNNSQGQLPSTSAVGAGFSGATSAPVQTASHLAPVGPSTGPQAAFQGGLGNASFQGGVQPASGMAPTTVNFPPRDNQSNRYPSVNVPDGNTTNLQWQN